MTFAVFQNCTAPTAVQNNSAGSDGPSPSSSVQVTVTASGVTVIPSSSQNVTTGVPVTFAVAATSNTSPSPVVGGSCPKGIWNGNTYILSTVTSSCSVSFSAMSGRIRYSAAPGGGSAGHAGTLTDPYQTIWENIAAAQPGDTIYLLPGTFTECVYLSKSGTASAPIVFMGSGSPGAKGAPSSGGSTLNCSSTVTGSMYMIPAYVVVKNLTIGPAPNAGAGLYLNSYGSSVCHDVTVDHVTIHDVSGSGYQSILCGAITLTNSVFYNNGLTYTAACTSGISLGGDIDDGTSSYNNIVNGNIAYANGNPANCNPAGTGFNSDGEGLIVDYGPGTPCSSFGTPPAGFQCATVSRTLVSNNVFYGNQSAGVEVYNGNNVDIIQNTLYHNQTIADHSGMAEIAIAGEGPSSTAANVTVQNNIVMPLSSSFPAISCENFSGLTASNNLNGTSGAVTFQTLSGCTSPMVSGSVTADPLFVNPSVFDFQLQASSPARGAAQILYSFSAWLSTDYGGQSRPSTGPWDLGAYQ